MAKVRAPKPAPADPSLPAVDLASGQEWNVEAQKWEPMNEADLATMRDVEPQPVYEPLQAVSLVYEVPIFPAQTGPYCWAQAIATILSYRLQQTIDPQILIQFVRDRSPLPGWLTRHLPEAFLPRIGVTGDGAISSWAALLQVKDYFGLLSVPLPEASIPITARNWYDWLVAYGPLWVCLAVGRGVGTPGAAIYSDTEVGEHAVVVHGISGDVRPHVQTPADQPPWVWVVNLHQGHDLPVPPYDIEKMVNTQVPDAGPIDERIATTLGFEPSGIRGDWRIWYLPPLPAESTG